MRSTAFPLTTEWSNKSTRRTCRASSKLFAEYDDCDDDDDSGDDRYDSGLARRCDRANKSRKAQ